MSLLKKYNSILNYFKLMGLNWTLYRIKYFFLHKSGYFDHINRQIISKGNALKLEKLFMPEIGWVNHTFKADISFLEKADNALEGKIWAFSHEYLDYQEKGKIVWNMNPVTKAKADDTLSWNRLPDFGTYGDIKLIWEISRFPQVYYFINAYSITKDEKYAKSCLSQIIEWIDANPYPKGVNYKCGQEIVFRIIAWMVAIDYFRVFLSKTEEAKVVKNIYLSILRVDANIDYSVRAVKNNHSLSESVGLILFGLYFKQFDDAKELLEKGMKYFQKESAYQVYHDGSYIQHSFTYERLALDLFSFVIMIADKKDFILPKEIRDRYKKMIDFLYSFIQKDSWLPNYGTNDGVNLFPVSNSDYRDFRPSLNFASALLYQKLLFAQNSALVEFFGLKAKENIHLEKMQRFDDGGYYILKNEKLFAFIRCHSYRDRPAQNDMLHLDIWFQDKNIFCDAGSFSYNTNKEFKKNFNSNFGHNTIVINDDNQMERVLNFGWSNWVKCKLIDFSMYRFQGEHYAYQKRYGISCNRTVELIKNRVIVTDNIVSLKKRDFTIKQIWNTKEEVKVIDDFCVQVANCMLKSNFPIKLEESYISDYYNSYQTGVRIIVIAESDNDLIINTTLEFLS